LIKATFNNCQFDFDNLNQGCLSLPSISRGGSLNADKNSFAPISEEHSNSSLLQGQIKDLEAKVTEVKGQNLKLQESNVKFQEQLSSL
jgi:TolA-binding protein